MPQREECACFVSSTFPQTVTEIPDILYLLLVRFYSVPAVPGQRYRKKSLHTGVGLERGCRLVCQNGNNRVAADNKTNGATTTGSGLSAKSKCNPFEIIDPGFCDDAIVFTNVVAVPSPKKWLPIDAVSMLALSPPVSFDLRQMDANGILIAIPCSEECRCAAFAWRRAGLRCTCKTPRFRVRVYATSAGHTASNKISPMHSIQFVLEWGVDKRRGKSKVLGNEFENSS